MQAILLTNQGLQQGILRCSSLNLSLVSFNMVDLCFMGCIVKMMLILESSDSSNVHAKYLGQGTSTHACF